MSGRWAQRAHFQPKYFVPGFVKPETLDDIIPLLPATDVSPDLMGKMQTFKQAVPRDIGKSILDKLLQFWNEADAAYLTTAPQMETIHEEIAHPTQITYATLEEIAERCLSGAITKNEDGRFHNPTLYALHRRILTFEIEIHAQLKGTLRAGGEYEIASLAEIADIRTIEGFVRAYVEQKMAGAPSVSWGPLQEFALGCRKLIDHTRKHQKFTEYGMIGPPSSNNESSPGSEVEKLHTNLRVFIRFMESWCGLQNFSNGSSLHGIGSTILRAIDRYSDVELDSRTGWTFLQEIGVIPFWETPHPYLCRLPETGLTLRREPKPPTTGFGDDLQLPIRKDWADLPVFCIDDIGAHEIDDGVSIEPTDIAGQYWVHVHVADPASHISPTGPVAEFAQKFVTNVYMPDRVGFMLDPESVQSKFSMGPGRPCLTFSAKLDNAGEILDYKVSAGRINNVIYVTPAVLEEVGSTSQQNGASAKDIFLTGDDELPQSTPSRDMTNSSGLTGDQRESLKILRSLGVLRLSCLRKKGGLDFGSKNYGLSINFDRPAPRTPSNDLSHQIWEGKPVIEISKNKGEAPQNSPLSYLMILAGEVCAKWCHERGVPTIYRITPHNPSKEPPADFFRRVVIPSRDPDGRVPLKIAQEYLQTVGAAQPSTVAGPHVAVGADMLSKCTSPLRRYGDLLMHWQIGAALREEARLGHSLIGNKDESLFPFSTSQIERLLPRIDTRERLAKKVSNDARNSWFCQFFIRAWKFGEARLPELSFVVRNVNSRGSFATGMISQFDFPAILQLGGELKAEDVLEGMEVAVQVEDVDMPKGRIILVPRPRGPIGKWGVKSV